MSEDIFEKTVNIMRLAGENCSVAAGGFNGLSDSLSAAPPSPARLADLRAHGQAVIDAAPVAAEQLRSAANAMERLGNFIWAQIKGANAEGTGENNSNAT